MRTCPSSVRISRSPADSIVRSSPGARPAATAVQLFTRSSREWAARPLGEDDVRALAPARSASGIRAVLAHDCSLFGWPRLRVDERQLRAVAGQPVRLAAKTLGISPSSYVRYARQFLGHSQAAEEATHA